MTEQELKEITQRGHVRVKYQPPYLGPPLKDPWPQVFGPWKPCELGIPQCDKRVGVKGIIRQSKRQMNSTETRFEMEKLKPMQFSGEIVSYRYESIRLKLANGKWYKADFQAMKDGRLCFMEVKGGRPRQREAGIGDVKVAAFQYPEFEFWIYRYKEGQWDDQRVLS